MMVEHPFQIPASIDSVPDDKLAVNAIGSLHNLIRSLFVFDRSKVYWAYVMGAVGVVGLCELVGLGLLIGLIVKRKVKMLSWHTLCKKADLDIVLPTLTSFTAFFLTFSGIWFMLFAVHRFRLNELLNPDELRGTVFWICVVFVPFWLCLYVQTIQFLHSSFAQTGQQTKPKPSIWKSLSRYCYFFSLIAFPSFVIFSTIAPAYFVQQDYNEYLPDILQYFIDSTLTEQGYEYTNTTFNAIRILRRYEDEALSIWKNEASVFSEAQPIFVMWSVYFGILILMYGLGASMIVLRKRKLQQQPIKIIFNIQPSIEEVDEKVIKDDILASKINKQSTFSQTKMYSADISKHIVNVVGASSVFVIVTFTAVNIVKLVENAEISNFICNLLGSLSTIALAASVFTITHLSILYANNNNPNAQNKNDNFSDVHTNDSDLTLV